MEWAQIAWLAGGSVLAFMCTLYVVAGLVKDASIVDVGWGFGFTLIANVLLFFSEGSVPLVVVAALVLLWGYRLTLHIGSRKINEIGKEDWRYKQMRKSWGETYWWRSFLQIFMLQGALMLVIAAPLYVAGHSLSVDGVSPLMLMGVAVWLLGFVFESVGDWQLRGFIKAKKDTTKKTKGDIMKYGLWKYTRHPNYFGEVTQWWGIFLIVVTLPYGWFAVVSPLTITFLLLKVSGITMLERKYDDNEEYQEYKKKTSAFFPMPPK